LARAEAACFPSPVRHALAIAAFVATVTTAGGAFPGANGAGRTAAAHMRLGPAALRFGRSLGSPTEGRLVGGMHLDETSYIRVEPADVAGDVRWGLEPLVLMIDRAARLVQHQFPGWITSVGHLSRLGGGDVDQHRSHESGRDADVGFFVRSAKGRQLLAPHFVAFRGDGTAPTWPGAYFDDAKNWALVASLVEDAEAHVTHLFVAAPLRARLLSYAEHIGAPAAVRLRAAEVMQQPHGTLPHDDHFHVRIGCPAQMTGCVENPAPRFHGTEAGRVIATAARPRGTEPMHARVTPAPRRTKPETAPELPPSSGQPEEEPGTPAPASIAAPMDDVDG
jgi:penicillin-insensitive murein endopeptidase